MRTGGASRIVHSFGVLFGALTLTLAVGSCDRKGSKPGELVVSVETDMAMPDQIDFLRVTVTMQGQTLWDTEYQVGKFGADGKPLNPVPATLTIVAGSNPSTPVTVVVAGRKAGVWRTYREATTTVPLSRSATLRMPVQWLCDGTVHSDDPTDSFDRQKLASTCGAGATCQAGTCVPAAVESKGLDDYQPDAIYGGAAEPDKGKCFDTLPCMIVGALAEPDGDCTIAANQHDLNVALRVASDGICDSTQTNCFVPLNGGSDEGWKTKGDRIQLPKAACEKLHTGIVSGIFASNSCQTKTSADPPCGKWSSVAQKAPPTVKIPDAAVAPTTTLVADLGADAGTGSPCCPLLSDGKQLYTCLCTSKTTGASVVAIDPATGKSRAVTRVSPPPKRDRLAFSAALFGEDLYVPDNDTVEQTPLTAVGARDTGDAGDAGVAPFMVDGAVYTNASLFVDADAVYALASGVSGATGAPVQLLKFGRDGTVTPFDTGGNQAILQFDADKSALYLATALDRTPDGGNVTMRTSRVVRIAKSNGALTAMVPEVPLTVVRPAIGAARGGYIGVQTDGTSLFALYEDVSTDAGALRLQIRKVGLSAAGSAPSTFYEVPIDPAASSLTMLGAVDGAVILSRVENDIAGDAHSSYVLVVPRAGGTPHIVKDFVNDYALAGLATDDQHVYWLNNSGSVFAMPRSSLQ